MRASSPLFLCLLSCAAAALAEDSSAPDPLFQSHETLDVTMSLPLRPIMSWCDMYRFKSFLILPRTMCLNRALSLSILFVIPVSSDPLVQP